MTASGSTLVLVQPGDTIETVAAKARQAGSASVELLVPADNSALQVRKNVVALRQMLTQAGIELTVISSDERVINAARFGGVTTFTVQGASVAGPLIPRPRRAQPVPQVSPGLAAAIPAEPGDAEMLDLLDRQATAPAPAYTGDDADFYNSLDDLSDTLQTSDLAARRVSSPEPGASSSGKETLPIEAISEQRRARDREASRPGRRAGDDRDRSRQGLRGNRRAEAAAAPQPRRRRGALADQLDEADAPRRRTGISPALIAGILVIAAILAAAWWALSSRVSVTVAAPAARVREIPVLDEVIPYALNPSPDTPTIHAAPVTTEAEFTVTGQVAEQTISPAGRARGVVTVINTIDQALSLPEGTEFIGRNAQGAEVRFAVDAPVTVPGATTSTSLTGRATTYGQAQVAVTARSPGATSNVPENTVKQILIPGQQLIACDTSNFICQNGPLQGGSDEPQWIVTEGDVQRVLGEALTGLYQTGIEQLRGKASQQATIDASTLNPDPQSLGQPESYDPPLVSPPVGQAADPNTRAFTLTVRTRFTALAVPANNMVRDQVNAVVSNHFAQGSLQRCNEGETVQSNIDRWTWDGASLKVSGMVICTPSNVWTSQTRLEVREALRGKTRADAEAALRELQARGLIGEYTIPEGVTQLPPLDVLLNVQFVDALQQ